MPSKAKKSTSRASMRKKSNKSKNNSSLLQFEEKSPAPVLGKLDLFKAMDHFTPLFPIQTRKRLVYYEPSVALTGVAGAYTYYIFSANGLFDVDITSTGHQPMGWDQLMLYYEQATVLNSRITVRAGANGAQLSAVGIALAPDTSSIASSTLFIENGLNTSVVSDGRGTNGTGQRIHNLSLSCDVAKYFGRPSPREILNDTTLYSNAAGNPTEQVYYHIASWNVGGAVDNTAYLCDVVIEFDAIFWEPRKAPLSLTELQLMRSAAIMRSRSGVNTLSTPLSAQSRTGVSRDERKS